jgi:putative toxin-antitoxin system antitoxin component (TIGR02293 family)
MMRTAKRARAASGSGEHLPAPATYTVSEKMAPYGQAPADDASMRQWRNFREVFQSTPVERIDLIRKGVNAADFKQFVSRLGIQQEKIFLMLGIATATVNRKASRNEALSQEDSEKVVGMAKLIGQVETMLEESGDPAAMQGFDAARWLAHWMEEPLPALGGAAPAEYMDTIEGQSMIAWVLAAMQTGVYA